MSKDLLRGLIALNLTACAFACVWAYAAYMYNWLNVGGGSSAYQEQWIALADVAPVFTLIAWFSVFSLSLFAWRKAGLLTGLAATIASLIVTPAVLVSAIWLLHRNFPWPSI